MDQHACQISLRRWLTKLAAAGFCLNLVASEKIEIVGDGVSLPQADSLLEERSSSFELLTDKPDVSGGFGGVIHPNAPSSSAATKKLLRELDRKKNWIFLNPYEEDKRATGLEKIEKEEKDDSPDHQKDESVLERYLQEKTRRQQEQQELTREESREDRYTGLETRSEPVFERFIDLRDRDDREFARELSLSSYLNRGAIQPRPQERDPYDKNHFNFTTVGDRPQMSPSQEADLRQREEQRSANFQRLLQPRSITPSIAGVMDPIVGGTEISGEAGSSVSTRRDDSLHFGRSGDSVFGSSGYASSEPDRSLPELGRSSALDSLGARGPAATTSFTTPSSSGSTPSALPSIGSRPFVLEIPKRQF